MLSDRVQIMVLEEGLEPSQPCGYRFLRPTCMPFHHSSILSKLKNLSVLIERFLTYLIGCALYRSSRTSFAPPVQGIHHLQKFHYGGAMNLSKKNDRFFCEWFMVEPTRIELVTAQCHCAVIPLHHGPKASVLYQITALLSIFPLIDIP